MPGTYVSKPPMLQRDPLTVVQLSSLPESSASCETELLSTLIEPSPGVKLTLISELVPVAMLLVSSLNVSK